MSRAKNAAKHGPVLISDCGKPAHALLTIEEYQRQTKQGRDIADSLAMTEGAGITFEPQKVEIEARPA